MYRAAAIAALLVGGALLAGVPVRSESRAQAPQQAPGTICGIAWETSLDAAKARAEREGKPTFLLHMMGRLDEEFC
jgi:hypothetical protein